MSAILIDSTILYLSHHIYVKFTKSWHLRRHSLRILPKYRKLYSKMQLIKSYNQSKFLTNIAPFSPKHTYRISKNFSNCTDVALLPKKIPLPFNPAN